MKQGEHGSGCFLRTLEEGKVVADSSWGGKGKVSVWTDFSDFQCVKWCKKNNQKKKKKKKKNLSLWEGIAMGKVSFGGENSSFRRLRGVVGRA